MAVSFKVPASPKRDIFNIDNFLGVDLTNTGANIDEVRSPHADNMVRYVPGKVRKRTGYHTQVEFSDRKDVNRASGTSDEYVEIEVTGTNYGTANFIFEPLEEVYNPQYYYECDVMGTYRVGFRYTDGNGWYWEITGTEGHNIKTVWLIPPTQNKYLEKIYIYRTSNNADDYIKIKNFRMCGADDTTATTPEEWRALPWTPAPEDNGVIFVRESQTAPVYGCHPIRTGVFEGNRVVNVNRALGTSDTFQSFVLNDSSRTDLYDLGNMIYRNSTAEGKPLLYYEFDYISDGEADIFIADGSTAVSDILNTNGDVYHYSGQLTTGSYSNYKVQAKSTSGTVNLQIKNFSVMYEKNDSYEWESAPEDRGKDFDIADVYNIGSKNYTLIDSYNDTVTISSGTTGYVKAVIGDNTVDAKGFVRVAFDIYTTTSKPVTSVEVRLANSIGYLYASSKTYNHNIDSEHLEFYVSTNSATEYVEAIFVNFTVQSAGTDITARISNIEVNSISPRKSYDISNKNYVYHVGTKLYTRASNSTRVVEIYNDANQHISQSWQLNEKLVIIDGKHVYTYAVGDEKVSILGVDEGYIPTVTISKNPDGGGIPYEPINMLQPGFYELFLGTAQAVNYQLSFSGLDSTTTKAWVLNGSGNWVEKKEGVDYTVDRGSGVIKFNSAPGVTPLTGEDNVKILAYRTVPGYLDRVAKCTTGTLFGVGGAADRLFLSGNPDYPNWDFYSEQYDPTYFPDTGYSALGSAASAIVGYAIVNNYLATFKDDFDTSQAVFIREGDLVVKEVEGREVSEPAFRLINTLQGNGVVAPYSFGYLQTEPLFLTRSGIYAITAQDITGEKYSQNRSFYLNGKLTKETGLENAVATVFNDMYVLAVNNQFYILDGLQATRTDRSEPYATRQYVAFYCTDIPCVSLWTDEQALWIGTNDGRICRFATEIEDINSYNDDGEAIYCCWETPDLDGKLFYKNKTFRYFAIRMMKAIRTSAVLWGQKRGNWTFIKEDRVSGLAFDFDNIDFELFSFSTDRSEKVVHSKVRVKKVDKARFRVENGKLNEPFGVFDLALEYIERGNYKG